MKKRIYKGREVSYINSDKLIKKTNKLIDQANKRIISLTKGIDINKGKYDPKSKKYKRVSPSKNIIKYDYDSWSMKKLYDRLDLDKGLIPKLKKSDTDMEILKTNKAIKQFMASKTSSIKGIKEVIQQTKESISNIVNDFDMDEVSDVEVEKLYSFFTDKDFNYATQYLDPSELWVTLVETKEAGGSSDDFIRRIENYIYSESLYKDDDLVDALTNIYNKFKK